MSLQDCSTNYFDRAGSVTAEHCCALYWPCQQAKGDHASGLKLILHSPFWLLTSHIPSGLHSKVTYFAQRRYNTPLPLYNGASQDDFGTHLALIPFTLRFCASYARISLYRIFSTIILPQLVHTVLFTNLSSLAIITIWCASCEETKRL